MAPKVRRLAEHRSGTLTAKLQELLDARPALQTLMTQPLPASAAFKLARLVQALNPEFAAFETTRVKLCEQHGKLNDSTDAYEFDDQAKPVFEAEIEALRNSEVSIVGEKIQLALLSLAKLSAAEMLNLQWLITE